MTKHPCEGMTRSEITAFEAIAINHLNRPGFAGGCLV
jgi:hypothetical protein